MAQTETADTPLMQQYQALKREHPGSILFFRLGDFYEMFDADAKAASQLLGVVLTSRHGVPMCGVPYHSSASYISRLLKAGKRVAICEQVAPSGEEAKKSKLFRREIVRVMTPGTIVEDELLHSKTASYLASLHIDIVGWGLAWIDASTGEFYAAQNVNDPRLYALQSLLSKISPAEIVSSAETAAKLESAGLVPPGAMLTPYFSPDGAELPWQRGAVWRNNNLAARTAVSAVNYLRETQPGLKETFSPSFFEPGGRLQLDESAIKTLDIVSSEGGDDANTLWGALDLGRTSMGSRLLKKWLLEPLCDLPAIKARHDFTGFLAGDREARESLAALLSQVPDIERVLGRVANASASPRDAAAVRRSLSQLPRLKMLLSSPAFFEKAPGLAGALEEVSKPLNALRELLEKSLAETPPAKLSDGGVIKDGFNAELDELRSVRKNSQKLLVDIELKEKEKTQIPSLKVGFNSVFGYYLEVTRTHLSKVPHYFVRKQTLVNAERFITEELKVLEGKILGAEERMNRLETHLFGELRAELLSRLSALRSFAMAAAELDAFLALAESAVKYDLVRPEMTGGGELRIEEGRHLVVERLLPAGAFVPNDIELGGEGPQLVVLTGPNMSGKSVYLRQNALIVLMAQAGSFVPAKSAVIGVTDRIMTRIGAQDRLSRGESTFMVEMRETASILNLAGPRSLLLLDEVGRGTSTFDGISIAWAVVEYLHKAEGGPRVLFATHYFELTELAEKYAGIKNFNVAVKEWTNTAGKTEVVFLHKITAGPADKSYGIHVAQLAGLPESCVARAREILRELESRNRIEAAPAGDSLPPLLPMFSTHPLVDEIKLCDPDRMTPLEALRTVAEWKKRAQ
ncbi:MAG: DNA mismatch repair protein MutS [Elusimicrobiales bacterium]|jgi:DNA mismatch repair protein MutS|nr:DNA mismatch repair protein MutS [Elusimicrobiales bacterium]